MRLIDADNVEALVRDVRKNLPKDSSDFFTRDNMLLNFEQILNLEPTVDTMGSDVLKSVKEIGGYTPEELIAMYDDYGRMAKEWEAYASAGLSPEVCAEYRKFEDEVVVSGMTFGEVVELMHAERDGRCAVMPTGKIGDIVEWDGGVCKELFLIRGIVIYVDGTRYDLGEFMPAVTDEHICRIIPRAEAEKALGKEAQA